MFYIMEHYKKTKAGGVLWSSKLRRAVFGVGLIIAFCLFSLFEIIYFIISKKNYLDFPYAGFSLIFFIMVLIQIIRYIYISRNRYTYITSENYRQFKLRRKPSYFSIWMIASVSFIIPFLIAILIDLFIKSS